jgi:hypothetical protein
VCCRRLDIRQTTPQRKQSTYARHQQWHAPARPLSFLPRKALFGAPCTQVSVIIDTDTLRHVLYLFSREKRFLAPSHNRHGHSRKFFVICCAGHTYIHTHIHTHIYISYAVIWWTVHTHTHIHTYTHTHTSIQHVFRSQFLATGNTTYIHTYIHIYIHTQTHTYNKSFPVTLWPAHTYTHTHTHIHTTCLMQSFFGHRKHNIHTYTHIYTTCLTQSFVDQNKQKLFLKLPDLPTHLN